MIVASDDTERHKPDPEPILHALERLGAEPREAAYVGDSPFDIRAAKAAGVHAVAVTWGGSMRASGSRPSSRTRSSTTPEELLDAL